MTIKTHSGFSKRVNSTKQPTGGTTVTCVLKENTSIETPVFILAGSFSTYSGVTCIEWDGRYYFVTDIVSVANGVTELHCDLDRMATFKTAILGSTCYIERASVYGNNDVLDSMITTKPQTFFKATRDTLPPLPQGSEGDGYVVLTVASMDVSPLSGGGTGVYFMEARQDTTYPGKTVQKVIDLLYSAEANLRAVFGDPFNAILRCTYIPCVSFDTLENDTTNFESCQMTLGNTQYASVTPLRWKNKESDPAPFTHRWSPRLLNLAYGNVNYKWQWKEPFSKWRLYLPFYGVVEFSPDDYLDDDDNVVIDSTFDYVTGDLIYTRKKKVYDSANNITKYYILDEYRTCIGVDIPITRASRGNILSMISGAGQAAVGIATQNVVGFASGAAQTLAAGLQSNNAAVGSFGANGVTAAFSECMKNIEESALETRRPLISIYNTGCLMVTDNYNGQLGYPVMQSNTVSVYAGGYIKTRSAAIECAGTEADKNFINSTMDAGFYAE